MQIDKADLSKEGKQRARAVAPEFYLNIQGRVQNPSLRQRERLHGVVW